MCLNPCFGGMSCEAVNSRQGYLSLGLNPCFGGMSCEVVLASCSRYDDPS